MIFNVKSITVEETMELGRKLGASLVGGDVVALIGELGAGKTAFAQGVGKGLGVSAPITSPTFTLIHEYEGCVSDRQIRMVHMDLYRLRHPEEAEVIGIEDAFEENAVCLIEWPEIAVDYLPEDYLTVELRGSGDMPRDIIFRSEHSSWENRLVFLV